MGTAAAEVKITPRMMAEAFWDMSDKEQADFFAELNDVIGDSAACHGQLQWCYMADELDKNPKAKEMACEIMSWTFVRTLDLWNK